MKIEDFKNSHKNDTFVVFGAGPTILDWKDSFGPEKHYKVGCSTVFMHKPNLDYYFNQDTCKLNGLPNGYHTNKELYDSYQPKIAKFYGSCILPYPPYSIGEHSYKIQDVLDGAAINYEVHQNIVELGTHPFMELYSVIFSCMQFGILCGVKNFIIVGCDITNNIRVGEEKENDGYKKADLVNRWKSFAQMTESLNLNIKVFKPIGLKGIFEEYEG